MCKKYRKNFVIGLLALGGIAIYFLYLWATETKNYQTYFAVLPHFTIQSTTIDKAYKNISESYTLSGAPLQILIISPDHFDKGSNNLHQKVIDTPLCFQSTCIPIHSLYVENNSDIPDRWIKEHWRWAHFPFIKKYFPQAKISLAKLSPRNPSSLGALSLKFHALKKNSNLLVIASVDFSHYTSEKRAYIHDLKSYYTLLHTNNWKDYQTIEVDCPTCLFLVNTRAKNDQQYPLLFKRDSSSTIAGLDLKEQNTSRAFILYTWIQAKENWIVLWFFGDLMFDRWVQYALDTPEKIINHFQDWYQQWMTWLSPSTNIHRQWFGLDMLGYNLETPYVDESCISQTPGRPFCSSGTVVSTLKSLWFDTVTLANNHTRDQLYSWYLQTTRILKENNISYAGWIRFKWLHSNIVVTKNIRWMNLALHAYNLYNRFSGDIVGYCSDLNAYTQQWYINIVSIHRGTEYQTTHNSLQENIGKKLVDCWADMIIGHHPHVIQDIQRYKDTPIIYSLWNFLFDQYFSEATKKGMYVLAHIPLSWRIEIRTGEVSATP
jgi:poly-gamma-glutamate synthesis protein (capsule biosynthesis protein)